MHHTPSAYFRHPSHLDLRALTGLGPSSRLHRLHQRFLADYDATCKANGARYFLNAQEVAARDAACLAAYRATIGQPAILRRARVLTEFAETMPISVHPDELIVGSQKFAQMWFTGDTGKELDSLGYSKNAGHIIHDYAGLLEHGIGGFQEQLQQRLATATDADTRLVLEAFATAMTAFARFIERHAVAAERLACTLTAEARDEWQQRARDLHTIAAKPPRQFRQALQLTWFMQIFLHAENPAAAISFGRLDQCLWPFLKRDIEALELAWQEASDLVGAFCLHCGEGDESQNLALGGVDSQGRDAVNPLSLLFLRTVMQLRLFQPSLTVRLHPGTDPAFARAACELAATGLGQPGFINDAAAVPALQAAGLPLERARDYGIVGCYEAAGQGDTYANTVGGGLTLPEILVNYLATDIARAAATFDDFLEGWYQAVAAVYQGMLAAHAQPTWNHWRDRAPSPFGSVLMKGCIESGRPLEAGGAHYSLFGINILGLGTTIDSLHAVRELVFRKPELTLETLAAAVAANFPDENLRQRLLHLPGRYGTDSAATNRLVHDVSTRIARLVLASRMENGVRPYPAFFRFTADIRELHYATPDGRHKGDLLSYGCGPAAAAAGSPTAILDSACRVAHRLCGCGAALALALHRSDMRGSGGPQRLLALVVGYFSSGGFHLHFNIMSAEELRHAQAHPEEHGELTVRISGLSARFVTLDKALQDALIERADSGV